MTISEDGKTWKCDICGKVFHGGHSNDPWPVIKGIDAECCDKCNETKVIPARIQELTKEDN